MTPPPARHQSATSTPREASQSFLLESEREVDRQITYMAQEPLSSECLDAPFLLSDDSCTHSLGQFSNFSSEEPDSEESYLSSLLDLNPSLSTSTLSTSSSMSSILSSVCDSETPDCRPRVLPLTSQERKAHYAWLDGIIGPASGIQEGMGTYKAFMENQREVYYDRLLLIAGQSTKETVRRRSTNEMVSWLGTSRVAAPESGLTRRTINFSCWSSPGPDADISGYSITQRVINSRLGCPITRLSRRRTFSATVDM